MRIFVTCHAGYRGEETPRAMRIDGREVKVRRVKARWRTPDCRYFEVLGEDGRTYRLCHDGGHWHLL
ncbi:MAG: hypothetical protein KGY61_03265 [Desulfobacterales bacterium]|nr:hypothetical protein [Desulfobacterales bacterium]